MAQQWDLFALAGFASVGIALLLLANRLRKVHA